MGLALAALQGSPAWGALASSARHFEQCLRGIRDTSNALSPMERVVFGLVLASTDTPPRHPAQGSVPGPNL